MGDFFGVHGGGVPSAVHDFSPLRVCFVGVFLVRHLQPDTVCAQLKPSCKVEAALSFDCKGHATAHRHSWLEMPGEGLVEVRMCLPVFGKTSAGDRVGGRAPWCSRVSSGKVRHQFRRPFGL